MALNMGNVKENSKEEIRCEVKEDLGVIGKNGDYIRRLRYISWNGRDPKYDIRDWFKDKKGKERCGRPSGTFTGEELLTLAALIYKEDPEAVKKTAKALR